MLLTSRIPTTWYWALREISAHEVGFKLLTDSQIQESCARLRHRARCQEPMKQLLPEAYGLIRETSRRILKMRHFDTQLLCGIALAHQHIAEMATGEGKTLTATLPLFVHALAGRGAHLATANDYLAERDAEIVRPLFAHLGLTVGVITSNKSTSERREAYNCDITYGTGNELGFDFLRDRLLQRANNQLNMFAQDSQNYASIDESPVGRGLHYVLVDEADSILIDEASTPLIIGAANDSIDPLEEQAYRWAARVNSEFIESQHFQREPKTKQVELLAEGRILARQLLPSGQNALNLSWSSLFEYVERAIKVRLDFHRDVHYVIRDEEVVIVDEFTGRFGEGRRWQSGIHQAIEAKEKLPLSGDSGMAARITIQDLCMGYRHLSGMTGTAMNSRAEFKKVYRKKVTRIPTRRPSRREHYPTLIFATEEQKWTAIIKEIQTIHQSGRPILVGTRSIHKSEHLSQLLNDAGLEHAVLNAKQLASEADMVAQAGQLGKITVATNMAGRGTDIKLSQEVEELGGLHVILTEIHESSRIDRQLIGRCARQGDPGSYRIFLSVDDEILELGYGKQKTIPLRKKMKRRSSWKESEFRKAQHRIEVRMLKQRLVMLHQEKKRQQSQVEAGLDPYLDAVD